MNLRLFFLLIIIETIFIFVGAFVVLLFLFLYFGSGASASSEKAIMTGNIAFSILVFLPSFFRILKYRNSTGIANAKSYLYSGLLVTIVSGIYLVFTI